VRPSESTAGQAWLTNFHSVERPAATVLIDSLRFVSFRRLWAGLLDLVRGLDPAFAPFVAYPERSLADGEFVAWADFHPGRDLPLPAGSDAFVAMVLKELTAANTPGMLHPDAALNELCATKCRSVIILTDNMVTGHQVEAFARAIARNPTLRSWRSYGLVSIRVAAYIASPAAIELLEGSRYIDSVNYVEVLPTLFNAPLADEEREAALDLCRRYGQTPKLGYAKSAALFVSERRAPDNMPSVFLRQGSGWNPLFPDRSVPASFAEEVGEHRPAEALPDVAARLGQLRLGRNERVQTLRRATRHALHVLTLASRAKLTVPVVAQSLGVDIGVARGLMSSLMGWGFVGPDGALTDAGRREIAEYRRGNRWTTAQLETSDAPYYHRGVR
jgi:hypothetical protein